MNDHFSDCIRMVEDVVHKHVHDELAVAELMLDLTKIIGNYAILEIKELNQRTNSILKSAVDNKEENNGSRDN